MKISRVAAQPSAWTFQIKPIFNFVHRYFDKNKLWVDPFAGENSPAKVKNDINPERPTEFHLDALEFLKQFEDSSVDGVFYDPPYSITQAKEIYDGFGCSKFVTKMDYWSDCKDQIARIVKPEGLVLSFGWNSGGCSNSRDFKKLEILMVYHGGARNDTICVAEQNPSLYFRKEPKMTARLTENGKTVGFLTFSDTNCNCPNCSAAHEITDKMLDKAFKTKRGNPVFKCACGMKLEAFYCPISRNYKLEKYRTAKDWQRFFKERRLK